MASSTVRVPSELYNALRSVKLSLERDYHGAAPTIQDLINVSIHRFFDDWDDPQKKSSILSELLKNRENARARMGKKYKNQTEQ